MPARRRYAEWRFSASNTHLYPGARLRIVGATGARPARGDAVTIEFADLGIATGNVAAVADARIVLALAAHTTARGTRIGAKKWTIGADAAAGDANAFKVIGRLSTSVTAA